MAEALPIIDGLSETAEDAEPLIVRAMHLIANRTRTAGDDIRMGLAALERAFDKESDPEVRSRYGRIIADLQGMETPKAGQGSSLGARRSQSEGRSS